jgi:hypothetical protein
MTSTLRAQLAVETRSPEPTSDPQIENQNSRIENCLDFIASDATLDRYSEIISPAGWKLDSYLRNPVFQNAHQYGDIIFTLGRALITEIRPLAGSSALPRASCLFQRIQFAVDPNPMARIAYALYKGRFLNAVSVGFIPIRWEDGSEQTGYARKYLEQELLEVSAVAIPANPNALALAYRAGAVERADLTDTAELLRQLTAAPGSGTGPTGPTSPTSASLTLLRLARELRNLLRS